MGGRGSKAVMTVAAKVPGGSSKGCSCVASQDEDQHGKVPYHAAKEGKVGSHDLSQMKISRKSLKAIAETAYNQTTMCGVSVDKLSPKKGIS
jgi:hypothetical protein